LFNRNVHPRALEILLKAPGHGGGSFSSDEAIQLLGLKMVVRHTVS
jgi:hypothetical protein